MNVADKYCKERLVSDNLRAQLKQALDENARLAKEMSEMKREARKATKEKAKAKREAKAEAKAESEAKAEDAQPAPGRDPGSPDGGEHLMELLAPAGSPEALVAAVQGGADAVYLGFGRSMPGGTRKTLRRNSWRRPWPTAICGA